MSAEIALSEHSNLAKRLVGAVWRAQIERSEMAARAHAFLCPCDTCGRDLIELLHEPGEGVA